MRRWEVERGLPVHRVPGAARGVVYAFTNELEEWLRQKPPLEPAPGDSGLVDGDLVAAERSNRLLWALAMVFLIAVGGAVYSYRHTARFAAHAAQNGSGAGDSGLGHDSVAVLPFTNVGGTASTDYLSDGITESLIGNLAHMPQLKVRSRDSVFRYKGKDIEVRKAGGELGASAVVSGRVMLQGDVIEVSAELTDVRDNTEMWGQHYRGKTADLIRLQQQMAGDIAEKLRSTLSSSERQQVTRQGTENPEAYELYLKGRYEWNKRTLHDIEKSISYFEQATASDPNYALAYSGLADAYTILPDYGGTPSEDFPRSNAAARHALELDPTLARAHAVLGVNEMEYDWDFAGGEAEFKKAFELDPNDATAHQWYSEQIGKIGGMEAQAVAEAKRAYEIDPLSPIITREIAYAYFLARRYDDAISVCQKLAASEPAFAAAHSCLRDSYWGKRLYPQVIEEQQTYGRLCGDPYEAEFASALAEGFRSAGWKGAVKKGIQVRLAQRKAGYYSAYILADLYVELGDKDQAFQWLNTAYAERETGMKGLRTDFLLDPLRGDPRFAELLDKVGVPHS